MAPGIGETLRRLIGAGPRKEAAPRVEETAVHGEYRIQAAPRKDGAQWITAGVITKTIDGVEREHRFVRGDFYPSKDNAIEFSIAKARQIIDLEGDRLFERKSE